MSLSMSLLPMSPSLALKSLEFTSDLVDCATITSYVLPLRRGPSPEGGEKGKEEKTGREEIPQKNLHPDIHASPPRKSPPLFSGGACANQTMFSAPVSYLPTR